MSRSDCQGRFELKGKQSNSSPSAPSAMVLCNGFRKRLRQRQKYEIFQISVDASKTAQLTQLLSFCCALKLSLGLEISETSLVSNLATATKTVSRVLGASATRGNQVCLFPRLSKEAAQPCSAHQCLKVLKHSLVNPRPVSRGSLLDCKVGSRLLRVVRMMATTGPNFKLFMSIVGYSDEAGG